MKSKRKIEKQLDKKTNKKLVDTLIAVKKNDSWRKIIGEISGSRKNRVEVNIEKIEKFTKQGETIVIPGKVLSIGEINKKIRVVALGFSQNAIEKILKSKSDVVYIDEEIKKNPSAKGIRVLK